LIGKRAIVLDGKARKEGVGLLLLLLRVRLAFELIKSFVHHEPAVGHTFSFFLFIFFAIARCFDPSTAAATTATATSIKTTTTPTSK